MQIFINIIILWQNKIIIQLSCMTCSNIIPTNGTIIVLAIASGNPDFQLHEERSKELLEGEGVGGGGADLPSPCWSEKLNSLINNPLDITPGHSADPGKSLKVLL